MKKMIFILGLTLFVIICGCGSVISREIIPSPVGVNLSVRDIVWNSNVQVGEPINLKAIISSGRAIDATEFEVYVTITGGKTNPNKNIIRYGINDYETGLFDLGEYTFFEETDYDIEVKVVPINKKEMNYEDNLLDRNIELSLEHPSVYNYIDADYYLRAIDFSSVVKAINFQPIDSSVPNNYIKDWGKIYTHSRKYGWTHDITINTRDRDYVSNQVLDTLTHASDGIREEFIVDLNNGIYDVTIIVGDPMFSHNNQFLTIEGNSIVNNENVTMNNYIIKKIPIEIKDNYLNLILWGNDEGILNGVINAIIIEKHYYNPYTPAINEYKGEIHIHTINSDGKDTPWQIATKYAADNYDFISITDHNFLTTDPKVDGLLFIRGEEISSGSNGLAHVNGINLNSQIAASTSTQTVLNAIGNQSGALAQINHPLYSGWTNENLQLMTGINTIEIMNGAHGNGETYWDYLLSNGFTIFGTAGDDNHNYTTYGNRAWINVFSDTLTIEDITEAIRNGNFYASTGADIHVFLSGRKIKTFTSSDATIEWITDNGNISKTSVNTTLDDYKIMGHEKYIRIRVTRDADGKQAWSQPIFVN